MTDTDEYPCERPSCDQDTGSDAMRFCSAVCAGEQPIVFFPPVHVAGPSAPLPPHFVRRFQ